MASRDNHVTREITLTELEMIMRVPAESEGDNEITQDRCMLDSQFKDVVSDIFTVPITARFTHCGGRDFMAKTDITWKLISKTVHQSPLTLAE